MKIYVIEVREIYGYMEESSDLECAYQSFRDASEYLLSEGYEIDAEFMTSNIRFEEDFSLSFGRNGDEEAEYYVADIIELEVK